MSSIRTLASRLVTAGPRQTLRWAWHEIYGRYRERSLGISTGGIIPGHELSANPDSREYEAISYQCLDAAFTHVGIRPAEQVFLDYGCGKGRAVIVAATYPFRRVIGVEINEGLARIAAENILKARRRIVCTKVEILTTDATTFAVPDEVSCILLFNSFTGATLASVIAQIERSLARQPRPLTIIYARPRAQRDALAPCDWLSRECDLPTGWWTWVRLSIYRSRQEPQVGGGDIDSVSGSRQRLAAR
jgi:SAM-dependent methyltransferase